MANKPTIILDLDDTLINTSQIRSEIVRLAQKVGVSKNQALKARHQVRSSSKPFTIDNYANFLFPNDRKKRIKLKQGFENMFKVRGAFNYPGVDKFLTRLSKRYRLILLTYGNLSLQKKKIVQSGLVKHFVKVIITPDNTKMQAVRTLIKTYSTKMLFIDNAKSICDAACLLGLPMIWVTSNKKSKQYFDRLGKRIEYKLGR